MMAEEEWEDITHTGPGTLAGRYLRLFWQPVYRAQELAVGRAVPVRIMSEDYTLYRGASGTPYLVDAACAHRGTQLSVGWVEGEHVRCRYHGWLYDASGQCVEQPLEDRPFCDRVRIRAFPVQEYLGLIFAYLGDGEAPPFPRYPQVEGDGVLSANTYLRECSYFNSIENNMDEVHIAFVHRSSTFTEAGLNFFLPEISGEETDYGMVRYGTRPNGTVRVLHLVMPNLLVFKGAPEPGNVGSVEPDQFAWRVPVDDVQHRSFNVSYADLTGEAAERYRERVQQRREPVGGPSVNELARTVLRGELHVDEIPDRPDIVNVQDVVAQVGQGAIPERANEHLAQSDALVVLLRKIWLRELQALADGRPMKQWSQPNQLAAAFGV